MKDKYAKILSEMIKIETVSAEGQTDLRKFRKFHTLLKKKFPKISKPEIRSSCFFTRIQTTDL